MTVLDFQRKFKLYAYPDEEIQAFEDWFYHNPGWAYKVIQVFIVTGILALMVLVLFLIFNFFSEGGKNDNSRKKR